MNRRWQTSTIVAFLALLCLTGCGSSSDTRKAEPANAAAVLEAYEAYWVVLLGALDPTDPDSAGLADHAVDPELAKAKQIVTQHRDAGEVVRGSYEHQADVTASSSDTATVSDCLTLKTRVFDAKTGDKRAKQGPGPFAVEVKLVKVEHAWKVSSIAAGAQDCPSGTHGAPSPAAGN